jgi:hypothetical protein
MFEVRKKMLFTTVVSFLHEREAVKGKMCKYIEEEPMKGIISHLNINCG